MSKLLHLIRHGYALHNELFMKMNLDVNAFRIPEAFDAPLTLLGHEQSKSLGKDWSDKNKVELVIVSPLMRTLQTADNIFKGTSVPKIALECVREYPMGEHTCNKRSDKDELVKLFPDVDFDDLKTNTDVLWNPVRKETLAELNMRINSMVDFIHSRKENVIALVNHAGFIGQFKDKEIRYLDNGQEELKHCYPYEVEL